MREWDLGVDLDKLQAFYAVAQLGGVGPAGRALGRSQPAVSHRLRGLADALGVALFDKVGRRLRPTAAGRALVDRCAELFALTRGLEAATKSADGAVRGAVNVGTYATVASHLLAPGLVTLLAAHPELTLRLSFGVESELVERLRRGELDFALLAGTRHAHDPRLEARALTPDRMLAVAAPGFLPRGAPRLPALRAARHLAWQGGSDEAFDRVATFTRAQALAGPTTVVVPHLETLRRLAMAGAGWTIVPRYLVADDLAARRLVDLRLPGLDVPLAFHVVTRARAPDTAATRVVRALLLGLRPGVARPARVGAGPPPRGSGGSSGREAT